MALKRHCSICGKKVEYGTKCECEVEKEKERYKEYDRNVRNNEENIKYSKFYSSKEWKRLSEYIKNKYYGMCLQCLLIDGEIINCDVAHHIEEIRTDIGWEQRLSEDNIILLCHSCHNNIHNDYTDEKKESLRKLKLKYEETYSGEGVK